MRDLMNDIGFVQAVVPQVLTATNTSAAIDLLGFAAAVIRISAGAIVGAGNFTPKLQECATSGGTYTDVVAADLNGTFPAALAASTGYKVGYIGNKRFLKTVLTLNSGTSIAASVDVVEGRASRSPVA